MNATDLLQVIACSGVAVPFALNNQTQPDGLFHQKPFTCPECVAFWLSIITLIVSGGWIIAAGFAPIFTMAIKKFLL